MGAEQPDIRFGLELPRAMPGQLVAFDVESDGTLFDAATGEIAGQAHGSASAAAALPGKWQTVKRNVAAGGRVLQLGGTHSGRGDARAEAARRNAREGREGRNVCWTIREVQ